MATKSFWEHIVLAYDGSDYSRHALDVVDILRSKGQHVDIVHSYLARRNFIPTPMRADTLKAELEARYENTKAVSIQIKERGSQSTNQIILQQYVSKRATLLALGFVGSKGPKPRQKDLCSRVRQFVYDSKASIALIKQPPQQRHKVVLCYDGSSFANEGLLMTIGFCKAAGYELVILHASQPEFSQKVKHLKIELKSVNFEGIKWSLQVIEKGLSQYLLNNSSNFEWVILTKCGERAEITRRKFVGNTCSELICQVSNNILLLQV